MTTESGETTEVHSCSYFCDRPGCIKAQRDELRATKALPAGVEREVGEASRMPGTDGFTMACFKAADVPVGTKLYATPQPSAEPPND